MVDFVGMDDISILPGHSSGGLRKARMSTHTSALIERVEVITRGARRRWRVAQKRSIVLESWAPGVVVSALCRQHGIGSGQLSTWRRELREGKLGEPYPAVLHFAQAVVAEPTTIGRLPQPMPDSAPDQPRAKAAVASKRQRRRPADGDAIEIGLPNGMVVRVGADVDKAALSRVLAAVKES
jgi:transposase